MGLKFGQEVGKIQIGLVNKLMLLFLTAYRIVPAMKDAFETDKEASNAAREDLKRAIKGYTDYDISDRELTALLMRFKHWIYFVYEDFAFYNQVSGEELNVELYWGRMLEEAQFINNIEPFKLDLPNPVIIDYGAGCVPYAKYFVEVNKDKKLRYIAIDKREEIICITSPEGLSMFQRVNALSVYDAACALTIEEGESIVLFLANFLHCVDVEEFLSDALYSLEKLEVIKVLEVAPNCILDVLFDYHMFKHCRGHRVGIPELSSISGWKIQSIENASNYHVMYTMVKA